MSSFGGHDKVTLELVLQGLREFVSGTHQASEGVDKMGHATETAGKKAKLGFKGMALWAGSGAVAYGAARFLKSATDSTTELAKSTLGLQKSTNLDTQTASAWVGVLKERGINSDAFRMSLTAMSRQMVSATQGSKTSIQAFHDLGVSQKLVNSGNVEGTLLATADAMHRIKNPAERAALSQTLLGRSAQRLAPLLSGGSKAIEEQLGIQVKYGNTLSGKSQKDTMAYIEKQREMSAAFSGVKLQLGVALMPVLLALAKVILAITTALEPLLKNSKLVMGVIIAMTAAFVAYQIAMVTATIATTFFEATALLPIVGTVLLVTAGLVLLGIGIYEVVKHWQFFHKWLIIIWDWIKKNWPLLLSILIGPLAIAAYQIYKHWDKIKHAGVVAAHAIKQAFIDLWNWLKGLPGKVGGVASSILHKIPGYGVASGVTHGASSAVSHLNPFHWQHGGVQPWSGAALVGEAGPELVHLPGGAQITPLGGGGGGFTIQVPVFLDTKQIALAVGQVTADMLARR